MPRISDIDKLLIPPRVKKHDQGADRKKELEDKEKGYRMPATGIIHSH